MEAWRTENQGFVGRIAAHCSLSDQTQDVKAMPARSSNRASMAAVGQNHTIQSSIATDAVPDLSRGSSRTSSLGSIGTELASFLETVHLLDEGDDGVLLLPNTTTPSSQHECLFHSLDCNKKFADFEEWRTHVLSHFRWHPPPTKAQCPFCTANADHEEPLMSWNVMLNHVAVAHFQYGHLTTAGRSDFGLFRFLRKKRIISDGQYKALFMAPSAARYEQPPSETTLLNGSTGQSNEPFLTSSNGRCRRTGNRRR